jgi:hypothetical protein
VAEQPWHQLPPEVAAVIRPLLPELVGEIIAAVREVPAYQRPLEGEFAVGVRAGVEEALSHLVREIEAGGPVPRSDIYGRLGRGEMRAGRTLDSLLSAYRSGARVMWRRIAAAGAARGLEPETLYLVAESIFAYIDVLSGESAEGYAREQTQSAGEAEMARRRLVRLLVRDPPPEPGLIQALAREVGWELPRRLAALAIAMPAPQETERGSRPPSLRLPVGALHDTIGGVTCAVIPDPDAPGMRAQLEGALAAAGARGGLGTTVGWSEAATSFVRARAALALAPAATNAPAPTDASGTDLGRRLISARDHAGELLLAADATLAAEFAAAALAPLATLSAGSQERLTATLRAWLDEQGRLGPTAKRLGIHPQTARYRVSRLRELFGGALDDAEQRFWLALALRASR